MKFRASFNLAGLTKIGEFVELLYLLRTSFAFWSLSLSAH